MPMRAVHPGEVLGEELAEVGVSPSELARQLEVPVNRITRIINGQRGISGDTVLRLAHCFGTSVEFWTGLQSQYDVTLAQARLGSAIDKLPSLKTA